MNYFPPKEKLDAIRVVTKSGREICALYGPTGAKKPNNVVLWVQAKKPDGSFHLCMSQLPVLGKLNSWELARLAERVADNADGLERGDLPPPGVENVDMQQTEFWRQHGHEFLPAKKPGDGGA